jgi:type IV pilus assembly protein PilQ
MSAGIGLAFSLVLLGAAAPAAVTEVTAVRVESDGASRTIHILTQGEPAFTVFRMSDPMRIVIDVARGSVAKLDSPIEINDGVVTAVATQQFSDGKTVLGRLMIAFEHNVDYEVKAVGNEIRVLARDNSPAPLAAKGKKPAPKLEPATVSKETVTKEAVTKEAAKTPVAEVKPAKSAEHEHLQSVHEIPSQIAVDKTLTKVSTDNRRDGATIRLQIQGGTPAYEVLELEDPARVVIDLIGVRAKSTHHPVYNLGEVGRLRFGYHTDKVRLVLDSDKSLPSYDIRATASGLEIVTAVRKPEAKAPAAVAKIEPVKAEPVAKPEVKVAAKPVIAKPEPVVVVAKPAPVKAAPPAVVVAKTETPKSAPVHAMPAPVATPAAAPIATASIATASITTVEKPRQLGRPDFRREGDKGSLHIPAPAGTAFEVDSRLARAPVLILRDIEMPTALETSIDTSNTLTAVSRVTAFNEHGRDAASKGKKGARIIANLRADVASRAYRDGDEIVWEFAAPPPVPMVVDAAVKPLPVVAGFSSEATQLARSAATSQSEGKKISIDSRGADLLNVLRLISEVSGENIVAGDDVGGKITLRLRNVPWEQALDVALKTKGFGRVKQGNIIRVAPLEKLQKEKEADLARIKTEEQVMPIYVRIISVNYAKASAIAEQVKQLLTKDRGKLSVDERTNSIIVEDLMEVLNKIEGLARRLDTQTPQVLIESRIVEANTSFVRDIGIQWGGSTINSPATGNSTGLQFPNTLGLSGGADGTTPVNAGTYNPSRYAVNLPAPVGAGAGGALGFIFGNASNTAQLSLRLSALENNGTVRIVSAPKVTMLDNTKARISQGVDIPISVVSAAGTNTRFIPANLQLEVTPHVTQDGSVMMDIHVSNNQPDFSRTGAQGDPTIQKKEAETNVLVKDGDTTVIGGIYTRNSSVTWNEIPFLGKIPVLGWLFKHKHEEDTRAELLIFITPRIVNRQQMSLGPAGATPVAAAGL